MWAHILVFVGKNAMFATFFAFGACLSVCAIDAQRLELFWWNLPAFFGFILKPSFF